jgi:hypothetical protein
MPGERGLGMISFEEASRRGRERCLKVRLTAKIGKPGPEHGGPNTTTLTVTIGRIERSPDGMFRYFQSAANELNPTLVDQNLRALKKRIKAHSKR